LYRNVMQEGSSPLLGLNISFGHFLVSYNPALQSHISRSRPKSGRRSPALPRQMPTMASVEAVEELAHDGGMGGVPSQISPEVNLADLFTIKSGAGFYHTMPLQRASWPGRFFLSSDS